MPTMPTSAVMAIARPNLWIVGEYALNLKAERARDRSLRLAFIADGNFDMVPGTDEMPFEAAQAVVKAHNAAVIALADRAVRTAKAARDAVTALDGELQMIEAA